MADAWELVEVPVEGGTLQCHVRGEGPEVLLVHGGPAFTGDYVEDLARELVDSYRVSWYQQRGLAPAVTTGPFTVDQHVRDLVCVLDALGWSRAWLVGHSWGGYLVIACSAAVPDRIAGVVSVDPLGCVGDGGTEEFERALLDRTPADARERLEALDERQQEGVMSEQDAWESLSLLWPAYFADPPSAPPMPEGVRMGLEAYAGTWADVVDTLPTLESALTGIRVPVHFVHGGASPMPVSTSTEAAARIPRSTVTVLPDTGHFVWHESPGAVRAVLDRESAR